MFDFFRRQGRFIGSKGYWDQRYSKGGSSGSGSYNNLASFKAEVLNSFVQKAGVESVIEFGCGDGAQLALASYPRYLGVDVSEQAVAMCKSRFAQDASKRFLVLDEYSGDSACLALSLDVIYHLVEDDVYFSYLDRLFNAGEKYVVIYSSNREGKLLFQKPHVRHREFLRDVRDRFSEWDLVEKVPNKFPFSYLRPASSSLADFYFFSRRS